VTRPRLLQPDAVALRGRGRPVVDSLVDRSPQWRRVSDALDVLLAPPPGEGRRALGDIADHALAALIRDYRRAMDDVVDRVDSNLGRLLMDVDALRRHRGRGGRSAEARAADMQALSDALDDVRTLRQHLTEALADRNGPLPAQLRHEVADALGVAAAQGDPRHLAGSPTPRSTRQRGLAESVTQRGGVIMSGETAGTGGIRNVHGTRDADGAVGYVIEGEILSSIPRERAPNFQSRVPSARGSGLPGYERAHLWGPGFGDEAADGIMYAPRGVNQFLQNLGIEGVIRQTARQARALGGKVWVTARAEAHPRGTRGLPDVPGDVLKRIEYTVEVEVPGRGRQPAYTVAIDVDPTGRPTISAPSHGHLSLEPSRVAPDVRLPPRPPATRELPVDLNLSGTDPRELRRLPGIGRALADRIAAFMRERAGTRQPVRDVDELLAVEGVGSATIAAIRDLVDLRTRPGGGTP
jgi:hypothetical protein